MIQRLAGAVPPGAGAVVMAGGIVSVCFSVTGPSWLSWSLFAVAAAVWAVLLPVLVARWCADPARWRREARLPASLTLVAGTAVLGSRSAGAGWSWPAYGLLAVAVLLCVVLLPVVLAHWSTPTVGTSFMVCVATQSLAVLTGLLARRSGQRWELYAATAAFVLGVVLYGVVASRFDLRQVIRGAGDEWVLGGALAISTLASTTLVEATARFGVPEGARGVLRVVTICLASEAAAAYVPLAFSEVIWPRPRFDMRRWSTVFPLGMAGLVSLRMSRVFHQKALWDLGRAVSWLALAVWLVVAAGTLRHVLAVIRNRSGRAGDDMR
ncbi:tellurite resistance/C4-dicarboxylate transporter family protein [Actinoallomurus sp. NBC_01490]|uniref:tellurite resistance/C4-dicarboxylate transporter family protein n=1 Tax=Actinoallomurus sp. NBC_01490 TaxID=2903557 RepID=UPI002E311A30|nr:tellurite resistance/C4-dicarboxylate transporter family protein [Actinoallomurus sp. NBC_01490]